jgi:rubrerythrin
VQATLSLPSDPHNNIRNSFSHHKSSNTHTHNFPHNFHSLNTRNTMGLGSSKPQPYKWACSQCGTENEMATQDCTKCKKRCPDSEFVHHMAAAQEALARARWG